MKPLLLAAVLLAGCTRTPAAGAPPVLAEVPAFNLTDQTGAAFDARALAGKVWVANFIFTRCPTICPTFTAKMAGIQRRSEGLQLVSLTVDPEYDSPEKLAEYAQKHGAGPRWRFLTGSREALEALVVKGMLQPMIKGDGSLASVGHGSHFVLVDGKMKIRGFYKFNDEGSVDQLLRDAAQLVASSTSP